MSGDFDFSVDADTTASIFFQDGGNDNIGIVLHSVALESVMAPVPVPASLPLLLGAIGLLGWARRS